MFDRRLHIAGLLVLAVTIATTCLGAEAPATGPIYPEKMSPLMQAAYGRGPVAKPQATELIDAGDQAYAAKKYTEAAHRYREALDYIDPQQEEIARAQILLSSGGAFRELGQHQAAEQPLREALSVFLRVEGQESLRAGAALLETSRLQKDEGQMQVAQDSAMRAYRIFEHRLGPSDAQTLIALRIAIEATDHQPQGLEALVRPKLVIMEAPGSTAPESLRGYFNLMLGSALIDQLRDKDAEPVVRKALEHYKRVRPEARSEIADCQLQLGEVLIHLGRKDEAKSAILSANQFYKRNGDPSARGNALYELAKLYSALPDYPSAAQAYEDVALAYMKSQDRDAPLYVLRARTMESVAICKGGDCVRGEKLARKVLQQLQVQYPQHRFTADAHQTLGVILQTQRKYPQAGNEFHDALALNQSLSLPPNILVENGMTLGIAYYAAEKFPEARVAFKEAIDRARSAGLPRSEAIADTKEMLGELLYSEGRISDAEQILLSAGDDYEALPGPHPRVPLGMFFLSLVGYSVGKPQAAVVEVRQLLQIFADPNHIGGLVLAQRLRALALGELGQSVEAREAQRQVTELCNGQNPVTQRACAIVERPNWILRCPPCIAKTRASSLEILRALNADDFLIGQT